MSEKKPDAHYMQKFVGVRMDPYRVISVYGITHPCQQHLLKKVLRGTSKGHSHAELFAEMRLCINRWEDMLVEDADNLSVTESDNLFGSGGLNDHDSTAD